MGRPPRAIVAWRRPTDTRPAPPDGTRPLPLRAAHRRVGDLRRDRPFVSDGGWCWPVRWLWRGLCASPDDRAGAGPRPGSRAGRRLTRPPGTGYGCGRARLYPRGRPPGPGRRPGQMVRKTNSIPISVQEPTACRTPGPPAAALHLPTERPVPGPDRCPPARLARSRGPPRSPDPAAAVPAADRSAC
jgi:hypothetical protein